MDSFGTRLRAARRKAGISQIEAGGHRYSGSYVSHLESGRRQPTPDIAEFLGTRLSVPASELLGADPTSFLLGQAQQELLLSDLRARTAWAEQDFEQANKDATRAAEAALRSNRPDSWWAANCLRAQSMLASGNYPECWQLAEMLSEHSVARTSGAMRAEMMVLASKARRAEGHLVEAVARADSAIEFASQPPTHYAPLAHALIAAISALVEIGKVQESVPHADRLRMVREHVESAHVRGLVAWALGNLDFIVGEIGRASTEHELAGQLLRPEANLRAWARFRLATARFHLSVGADQGVRKQLDTASVALELVGHSGDQRELLGAYAELDVHEGSYREAVARIESALTEPCPLPDNRRGELEVIRATAWQGLDHRKQAQQALARAAMHLERAGALPRALEVWRSFAELTHGGQHSAAVGQPLVCS